MLYLFGMLLVTMVLFAVHGVVVIWYGMDHNISWNNAELKV